METIKGRTGNDSLINGLTSDVTHGFEGHDSESRKKAAKNTLKDTKNH